MARPGRPRPPAPLGPLLRGELAAWRRVRLLSPHHHGGPPSLTTLALTPDTDAYPNPNPSPNPSPNPNPNLGPWPLTLTLTLTLALTVGRARARTLVQVVTFVLVPLDHAAGHNLLGSNPNPDP